MADVSIFGDEHRHEKEMKTYRHPEMGRFTQDEFGGYFQLIKSPSGRIRLILDCGFDRARVEQHLKACEKIAARFHPKIAAVVDDASMKAATRLLNVTNEIRAYEGKKPISSADLQRRLKLLDVCVAPTNFVVTFSGNAYDDEHSLYRVRYGPRGGLRSVYIE
ncbi:MAG: hypothetical protein MI861_04470 [Pirellulales bacterium]|nr:hypothetical protein [Pirellulales bacterium]